VGMFLHRRATVAQSLHRHRFLFECLHSVGGAALPGREQASAVAATQGAASQAWYVRDESAQPA